MIGKFKDLTFDIPSNRYGVSILLEGRKEEIVDWYTRLAKHDRVNIDAKRYTVKRSHDANSYYWVLVTKMAQKLGNTTAMQHNLQLRNYGQLELIDGKVVCVDIPDTEEAEKQALESLHFHIRPTSEVYYRDDRMFRVYHLLRGSHTYKTEEMAHLINSTVEECKILGIETLTPAELERLYFLWTPSSK